MFRQSWNRRVYYLLSAGIFAAILGATWAIGELVAQGGQTSYRFALGAIVLVMFFIKARVILTGSRGERGTIFVIHLTSIAVFCITAVPVALGYLPDSFAPRAIAGATGTILLVTGALLFYRSIISFITLMTATRT